MLLELSHLYAAEWESDSVVARQPPPHPYDCCTVRLPWQWREVDSVGDKGVTHTHTHTHTHTVTDQGLWVLHC